MLRMFTRAGLVSAAGVASLGVLAAPALATSVIGTATTAKASNTHVKPGSMFSVAGAVRHGTTALCGQTVYLYERSSSKAKWVKATNTSNQRAAMTSGSKACTYVFYAVTGLKHGEQYEVVHPAQTVNGKSYGRSVSKVVTVAKAQQRRGRSSG